MSLPIILLFFFFQFKGWGKDKSIQLLSDVQTKTASSPLPVFAS